MTKQSQDADYPLQSNQQPAADLEQQTNNAIEAIKRTDPLAGNRVTAEGLEALHIQQEALMHAERLSQLGEMASGIAHELNQPLSALLSYAQTGQHLLKQGRLNNEQLAELLDKMASTAELGGVILKRIRNFARKSARSPRRIQLSEVISEAVALAELRCREKHIVITHKLMPGLPTILADPVEIQQVVINLIINGIEAIDDAGSSERHITIECHLPKQHAILECCVADSGPGITEQQLAHLFHPFHTTKRKGMGLGLSLSRSIIERNGGELRYAGRQNGCTHFCFSLPLRGGAHDE